MRFPSTLKTGAAGAAIRRIALLVSCVLFVALLLNSRQQYVLARNTLDAGLEASLVHEGEVLADSLAEYLDPVRWMDTFYADRAPSIATRTVSELTGAHWVLLDATGEVALSPSGAALYESPAGASATMYWNDSLDLIERIAEGEGVEPVPAELEKIEGRYLKRVFIPVRVVSEFYATPWILVGQAGEGTFSTLFQKQRSFVWTVLVISFASLAFLLVLTRGILRTERLESDLREAEESMELESLTSTLAHELRNPLAIIQSSAEILSGDKSLSDQNRELALDLISEVERSQDVLSRRLHPERSESLEIEDVVAFSDDFWRRRKAHLQTHKLELETDYADAPSSVGSVGSVDSVKPIAVRASPLELEQILDNCLRNSMEVLPEGGRLRFVLQATENEVALTFQDNGPGWRGAAAFWKDGFRLGSDKPEGKGVGLRLARRWIKRWGGGLRAGDRRKSWFGKSEGAEVRITLLRIRDNS